MKKQKIDVFLDGIEEGSLKSSQWKDFFELNDWSVFILEVFKRQITVNGPMPEKGIHYVEVVTVDYFESLMNNNVPFFVEKGASETFRVVVGKQKIDYVKMITRLDLGVVFAPGQSDFLNEILNRGESAVIAIHPGVSYFTETIGPFEDPEEALDSLARKCWSEADGWPINDPEYRAYYCSSKGIEGLFGHYFAAFWEEI